MAGLVRKRYVCNFSVWTARFLTEVIILIDKINTLQVLDQLPESWPIGVVSDFFVSALRRLVDERCETAITKSLSGCQSLMMTAAVIEELDALRPKIETAG